MNIQLEGISRQVKALVKWLWLSMRADRQEPTFVFHHLPRCGGTSLRQSIGETKTAFSDYRIGWGGVYPLKYPINKLGTGDCLCGHFETEGYYLFQRYPEIATNRRFRLFTFLRDPLDLSISEYFYRLKNDQEMDSSLLEYLLAQNNYLARILGVDRSNLRERMDRYDFIGVVEKYEESLLGLSALMECNGLTLNRINGAERNDLLNEITPEVKEKFKEQNSLDYLIYKYAIEKFDQTRQS